jgi:hypothetical protein
MADEEDDEIDSGSSGLVKTLYGPELGQKMAIAVGYKGAANWRKILEPAGAVMQCTGVIGSFTSLKKFPCYLCGQPIKPSAGAKHELSPECEHILPVTLARWFLDLYRSKPQVKSNTDWLKTALSLEYAWAHKVCNQAKKADSFITQNSDGTIAYSQELTVAMLNKIKRRATIDLSSPVYKNANDEPILKAIATMNVSARAAIIYAKHIEPIVKHVNQGEVATAPGLTLLARTSAVVDEQTLSDKLISVIRTEGPGAQEKAAKYRRELEEFRAKAIAQYPFESYIAVVVRTKTENLQDTPGLIAWKTEAPPALQAEYDAVFDDWFAVSTNTNSHIAYHYAVYRWLTVLYDEIPSTVSQSNDPSLWALRCRLYVDIGLAYDIIRRFEKLFKQKGISIPPMAKQIDCSGVIRADTTARTRNAPREFDTPEDEDTAHLLAELREIEQTVYAPDDEPLSKRQRRAGRRTLRIKKLKHRTLRIKKLTRRPLYSTSP